MIYFVRAGADGPFVKIGSARDVQKRLAVIEAGSPFPLVLLRQIEGGRPVEHWLHRHFGARRVHREWFSYCNEMLTIEPPATVGEERRRNMPYDRLIKVIGSQATLVSIAETHQSTVSHWAETGIIPSWWIPVIMRRALGRGVTLPAELFVPGLSEAA